MGMGMPCLPPRDLGHHGRLPYVSSIGDHPSPYPQRALTPTFPQQHYVDSSTQPLLDKSHGVGVGVVVGGSRPTPLRYTLPARGSQHWYERTLPISSLSSPSTPHVTSQSVLCEIIIAPLPLPLLLRRPR